MTNQPVIDARPTKAFFIDMLTKDIGLVRAILDLVDNSVDGALRSRPNRDFTGLTVRLELSPEAFRISDNCGGIPFNVAEQYAFRFGRPLGMQGTAHSVGQFGVGMKRALFKLGTAFQVESRAPSSSFSMSVNVDEWKATDDDWQFKFDNFDTSLNEADNLGTTISVSPLHTSVASEFESDTFIARLSSEMEAAHQEAMRQGLAISLNQIPLNVKLPQLLSSDQLRPAYEVSEITDEGRANLMVKIYAGVSTSEPISAGWYVYCNGRMVLEADQTLTTGWGEGGETTIPKYHNQFARFRGFVFFDSDDPGLLPWNTTKTGVDQDSPTYRRTRQRMIALMRPVIDFLNRLDAEISQDEKPLDEIVSQAPIVPVVQVTQAGNFTLPSTSRAYRPPTERTISYKRNTTQINKAMEALGVTTLREVGEETFDYYYRLECED